MDSVDLVALARKLIDIDSTTGGEGRVARVLADELRTLGYQVTLQPVAGDRVNVIATTGDPVVIFSTHFDCVPAFFPSRIEHGRLHGRGSSDAKGILAAQLVAAERLRARGERRVGLLFVAGEERGSDGALAANTVAPASARYLINGEPTDNRLATATRGVYRVKLTARGRAAHSSRPDLGDSAIERLVDVLVALRTAPWPSDPDLGATHYTVGLITGGVAPNVIPAEASAELLFRSIGPESDVRAVLERAVAGRAEIAHVLTVPPVRLKTLPGFETAVFSFTTDIPFLDRWGTPLLIGPGSVEQAHTADESVEISALHLAADLYERLASELLAVHG
ncbi:MAG: M20/M25/M40 family metallo-hydrolase [Acidobacteria bacterium]|nr:MAG: M20/M25/M40 family metallo-hydrolase [Acidobacteriota bacterium]